MRALLDAKKRGRVSHPRNAAFIAKLATGGRDVNHIQAGARRISTRANHLCHIHGRTSHDVAAAFLLGADPS